MSAERDNGARRGAWSFAMGGLAGLAVLCSAGLGLAGCAGGVRGLPPPPSTPPLRPTTAPVAGPAFHNETLPVLSGSTTSSSVPLKPGRVSFSGRVADTAGKPVPGARVHIERLVGAGVGTFDVTTANDGRYTVTNALAGLLRVRAWRAPDFVQDKSLVLFVTDGQNVDLVVDAHHGPRYRWAIAPASAFLGQSVNVALQVAELVVTSEGVRSVKAISGIAVTLGSDGPLRLSVEGPRGTDAEGVARFALRCDGVGASVLNATLSTGETAVTEPFDCADHGFTVPTKSTTVAPGSTTTVPALSVPDPTTPLPAPVDLSQI